MPPEPTAAQLLIEIEELRTTLQTRNIIGQVKGVIRLRAATDADQVFTLLC